ncbi:MAG: hypothetical protein ACPG80_05490 [Rickettsiales bacterium]
MGDNTSVCTDGDGTNNGVTCNGNGNGIIDDAFAANQEAEVYLVWQHLALAGMIEGQYTGIAGDDDAWEHNPGVNAPRSRISGVGWSTWFWDDATGNGIGYFGGWYGNALIDDGMPGQGELWGFPWDDCTTAANDSDHEGAEYSVSDSSPECALIFRKVF